MKAKKKYGQHFLTNNHYAERIAKDILQADETGRILEIGPGRGFLTQYLLEGEAELKMVELDEDMVQYLNHEFRLDDGVILHQDFLKMDLRNLFDGNEFSIVGNFPYNISSQIVFSILDHRNRIPVFSGMFQKEVANRLAAPHGTKTYGILSVLLQAFYTVEKCFDIGPGNFNPPPKVDSSVILCKRLEQAKITDNIKLFFTVVKMAFNQRRKMLRNSIKGLLAGKAINPDIQKYLTLRPEQMSVEDFVHLTKEIKKQA
ncbi:MAG TPA: 16S rRNA (adenine(1518)-N(6)/adenine(1519)-N(6))-dimethyltransferase RsmA [Saprospiraceae bacterium]|nr:16S rRNA (adenine(1518)-N(6)/adenine(1519)-N(6))-dimethyltransferase RsmA [Saprospiraceae bacterium]